MVLYLLFQPLPESKFQRVNIRNIGEIIKKHYCFGEISEFSLYLSPQKFSVMLTLDKIYQASFALKTVIRRTDLISAPNINPDSHIYLKPENLQITGSFKVRGACFKIAQLTEEEKAKGVVACSAGNHAQGVALAATTHGIKSLICLPDNAPISKIEATKWYGADVCLVEGVYDDAYQKALKLRDEKGYTFVHPFDDEDVIAGQGTIGLELLEQLPDLDAVIVPIGGGGLISGVAFAIKHLNPNVKIYGVQASGAPSMLNSIEHNKIERMGFVRTIADGIAVKEPGEHTFEYCKKYVDEIVTVNDDEISTAILALIEQHKLIAEGAGAVAVAAAMFNKVPIKGKKAICLVSGGNIDVTILSRVIGRGLQKSGRSYTMTIELVDKPGQLQHVSEIIARTGANVVSVHHERVSHTADINGCYLRLEMETRNQEHIDQIQYTLTAAGYKIIPG
ncbi:threonine ammonia-lyase [Parabacteroides goldsteinii DSM 19448 = WAL 12034]|jgi:threonine dehydratase|uniref:Threonine ammonia-lyase n=12 Tax=Parabacteroides TaxID=375288 RepID=A0A0F5JEJ8_9BACT|nr:threonine ammonia-lyase [Parabacteroides goldsteinii DSM 19448 = WAL 12034]